MGVSKWNLLYYIVEDTCVVDGIEYIHSAGFNKYHRKLKEE